MIKQIISDELTVKAKLSLYCKKIAEQLNAKVFETELIKYAYQLE